MNPRPRAVIADDEPLLLDTLAAALGRSWPELQIVARCTNGDAALAAIRQESPDVAFLDIRMPERSGLDVARLASDASRVPLWVFVTAYDAHALDAFDREAIDYLLKPIDDARLGRTVERLRARLGAGSTTGATGSAAGDDAVAHPSDRVSAEATDGTGARTAFDNAQLARLAALLGQSPGPVPLRWLRATLRDELRLVPIDEVVAFEAADKYLRVLTRDDEALVRMPLKTLLERLPPDEFWQIHRGTVVRVREIGRTTRTLSGKLVVHLRSRPERFEVSRAFTHLFRSD